MSSESNGVAQWLCPLCQTGQSDRSSLSLHLTEQHSVLPSCVDKLLDIVSTTVQYSKIYVQIFHIIICVRVLFHHPGHNPRNEGLDYSG